MNRKSRLARCAMFAVEPVSRLSMPTTEWPRSRRASERGDPMKPAAPVMTTLLIREMPKIPKLTPQLVDAAHRVSAIQRSVGVFLEAANQGQAHDLQVEAD